MSLELLVEARRRAAQPVLTRALRADDVPLEFRDTRALLLANNRREWFTLSMADAFQNRALADNLPLVALAAKATGESKLKDFCIAQLEELKDWQPLNRPGWGLFEPGPPAPDDWNDGNWLETGWGMRALASTLDAMEELVPAALLAWLHDLMQKEIAGVRDDFQTRRVWFWNLPVSNQFVLPNCGVLLACLQLGRTRGDEDYEFAIANLLRALDSQGNDGAFRKGATYGSVTQKEMLNAGLCAARIISHPHLKNFGRWLLHLVQPGLPPLQSHLVNAFDGNDRSLEVRRDNPARDPKHPMNKMQSTSGMYILDALMLHAEATRDAQVIWFLQNIVPQRPLSAVAAEYSAWLVREKPAVETPPVFASYNSSPLAVWRSSWKSNASGVWIRGGSTQDSHDHADRGHVNVILGGREILIEAGSGDCFSNKHLSACDVLHQNFETRGACHRFTR